MDVDARDARLRALSVELDYPPINLSGRSQRYIRFHKAFRHAFKQASEKWTDEDMRSCFPTLYNQNPDLFRTMRQLAIEQGQVNVDLKERQLNSWWNVADALDTLHETIVNAKERAKQQESSPREQVDVWNPTLDTKAAVRAQLMPLIHVEIERVKGQITELEAKDERLDAEMKSNIAAHASATEKIKSLLTNVRDVADELGQTLRTDEIVEWALEVDETGEA